MEYQLRTRKEKNKTISYRKQYARKIHYATYTHIHIHPQIGRRERDDTTPGRQQPSTERERDMLKFVHFNLSCVESKNVCETRTGAKAELVSVILTNHSHQTAVNFSISRSIRIGFKIRKHGTRKADVKHFFGRAKQTTGFFFSPFFFTTCRAGIY